MIWWVFVVPMLGWLTAWTATDLSDRLYVTILLVLVTLWTARGVLSRHARGLGILGSLVGIAAAAAVSLPLLFGSQAYLVYFGERIDAYVAEDAGVGEWGLVDPVTGRSVGTLSGSPGVIGTLGVGDTVEVLAAPAAGVEPVTVERAELGRNAATSWLVGWSAGAVMIVVSIVQQRRGAGPGGRARATRP